MPSFTSSGAAAHGSSGGGSSAAVLEFVCLFTHDLKRKQKRWQDGRLKYHTFNNRVMVHDERGNFVGDMHWNREWDFDEGEEIELERGGVIVQVAECVGSRNQDLTELIDKRAKEKEERQLKAASRPSLLRPPIQSTPLHRVPNPQDHFQTRHRPLHQVIGTPTGHHGRAVVPAESPFEQRHNPLQTPESRPAKRRKYDTTPPSKLGYARSLFGAPLTLSAVPMSSAPRRQPLSQTQRRPEVSSSPQEQHGRSAAADSCQTPNEVLPRPGLHADHSESFSLSGRDRTSHRREGSRGAASANNSVPREQEQTVGLGHEYGPSHHFHAPPARDAIRADPPVVRSDNARTASRTETRGRAAEASRTKERESAVIIIDDGADTTALLMDEVCSTGEAGGEIRSKPPPVVSKKKLATKTKKTTMPRSPSPLGESAVNTVPRLGGRKGAVQTDGVAKDGEKRTELRLKSRQKRGLLVASELPKRAKRAKAGKASVENASRTSRGMAASVPPEDGLACTTREQASPQHGREDLFAYSPTTMPEPMGVERRSKSTSPGNRRKGAGDADVGSAAKTDATTSSLEDGDPLASFPKALEKGIAGSRLPLPVPKRNIDVTSEFITSPRPPRAARPLADDRTAVSTGRSSAMLYDVPDDTDDEYFGVLPTPVLRRDDVALVRKPVKTATKKSSKFVKPTGIWTSSPTVDTPSSTPPPVSRGRDMQKNGAKDPSRQIESPEERLPRLRRAIRRPVDDEEFPQVPVGPRLARLGKNVKSKEVIGYIPLSSPDEDPWQASPVASERRNLALRAPSLAARDLSPHEEISRESAAAEKITTPAEDMSSRLDGLEELTAAALGRSLTDSAGSEAEGLLRRQNSLPETTRPPPFNEQDRRERKPASDGQASRPGLMRHRSVVAAEEHDMDAARIVQARAHGRVDLPVADPPSAIEVGISAPGDNALQLAPHPDDLPQHRLKPTNATCSTIKPTCTTGGVVGGAPSDELPITAPSNPPRIANPATRGRKAALRSHAAGQVPQSILPPAEPVPARLVARSSPETRQGPSGNERPKRKMTFPGFMSVKGGGPWSREAHDLLESGRPPS